MEGTYSCENFLLHPILDEISTIKSVVISISLHHIFRERNDQGDGLSKEGLMLDSGSWKIWEEVDGIASKYVHRSFY